MESNRTEVKIVKGGPYVVSGDLKVILPDGNEKLMEGNTFFCRCGHSKNKPFCDGSHKKNDFDK